MKTRFAPSPTGDLHVGGAWTAIASHALGGTRVLRVEDIDPPRVVPGSAERILEDLAWLGLVYDEGPIFQSDREARYEEAIASLETYPCDCSRGEIARVASAPHAGEERMYPGTCRDLPKDRTMKRAPSTRLRVPADTIVAFDDLVRGHVEQRVDVEVGDFVLRRGDGIFAYQLAVAVDDGDEHITHVVRADDLLASTARQILLMRMLGLTAPQYAHVPMVVGPDGDRLAKRAGGTTIRELRAQGISAACIVDTLSAALNTSAPPSQWRRSPWPLPAEWPA